MGQKQKGTLRRGGVLGENPPPPREFARDEQRAHKVYLTGATRENNGEHWYVHGCNNVPTATSWFKLHGKVKFASVVLNL